MLNIEVRGWKLQRRFVSDDSQPTSSTSSDLVLSQQRKAGNAQPPWRALLVLSLGLIATTCLWFLIRGHEQRDLQWAARIAAESFRADIDADLQYEITGLIRLAILAVRVHPGEDFWKKNTELYFQRRPGCIAIELLTRDYRKTSIVYAPGTPQDTPLAFGGIPLDLLKEVSKTAKPIFGSPVAVKRTNRQRVAIVPIDADPEPSGFVVAFFDVPRTFDRMLADVKHIGFSLAILEHGQEQFRLVNDTKKDEPLPQSTEEAEVIVPGVVWELRVWPQASTLYAMDAKLPELTLVVGALISFLLALTVHFWYSAMVRSRTLHQLNAELSGEIRQRQQAEEELRRAQNGLEARVQQRTAELSSTNTKLEREILEHARAEESLQRLTGQLFQTQDEERRRLARALHDGATQNLIALSMNMASMRRPDVSPEQRTELLDDSARLIQQAVGELRTTSHLLHPPLIDELGLPATLRSYVDGFSARSGILVGVVLDPELGRLNREVELGIFRVVQESLANVHRHSHSDKAHILLRREDSLVRLEISDEGTGIPPDVLSRTERGLAGVGIAGMRERVRLLSGRFELDSASTGTTIRILFPLMEAKPSDGLAVRA